MDNSSGKAGEDRAAGFLAEKGFRILFRNYRSRFGEIDIIAENGAYLVFAEVKTRESGALTGPLEAVTPAKRRRIAKTALLYLESHPTRLQPRFDVIAVETSGEGRRILSVRHLQNAFGFSSYF